MLLERPDKVTDRIKCRGCCDLVYGHTCLEKKRSDAFTATQPYMVVSVNLAGNANGGLIKTWLDNIIVYEQICSPEDLNGDCSLNMKDLGTLADTWLRCNRVPSSECWK
ncbi:MAG: hypothetical protein WCE45_00150 [Sedimentisphaerales bacterium]